MNRSKVASLTSALLSLRVAVALGAVPCAPERSVTLQSLPRPDALSPARRKSDRRLALRFDALRHRRLAATRLSQIDQSGATLNHSLDRVVATLLEGRCNCLEEQSRRRPTTAAMVFTTVKTDHLQ
jgi:hypothetical protein